MFDINKFIPDYLKKSGEKASVKQSLMFKMLCDIHKKFFPKTHEKIIAQYEREILRIEEKYGEKKD